MDDDPVMRFLTWFFQLHVIVLPACLLLFLGSIGWGVLKLYRRSGKGIEAAYQRLLDDAEALDANSPGDVDVVFHTYRGFLVSTVQTEHRIRARPEAARAFLWTLHKSNCTWGVLGFGLFLIPIISYVNYLSQKRSIRRQEAQLAGKNP